MAKVTGFKVENHGWEKCDIELEEHGKYGKTTHQYWGVKKSVVMKLLNAKKPPDISDFDSWMKTADGSAGQVGCNLCETNFWEPDDKK